MRKIELSANRKRHKPLILVYFDTEHGRSSLAKKKENLEMRGFTVTINYIEK